MRNRIIARLLLVLLLATFGSAAAQAEGDLPQNNSTPQASVQVPTLNVRSGPSTAYSVIGQVHQGERYDIVGRSAASRPWWMICCLPDNVSGWVTGDLVTLYGDTAGVPIVPAAPPAGSQAPQNYNGWKVSYFNNVGLSGAPALVQDVPEISFKWGTESPHSSIRPDNFSARFERTLNFSADNYQFNVHSDDGVRVWIDNQLALDQWHDYTGQAYSFTRQMSGAHAIRVEYYERIGSAFITFSWGLASPPQPPQDRWRVTYFNDIHLSGEPLTVRDEDPVRFKLHRNWSLDSPIPGVVPADNWSGRYESRWNFESGDYYFEMKSNDGAKMYLDGHLIIDAWRDGDSWDNNIFHGVSRGTHNVTIEFYERGGHAWLEANWHRANQGGPSPN